MRPHRIHSANDALLLVFSASACAGADLGSDTDEARDRNQSEPLSTVRHSQPSSHFERGQYVRRLVARFGDLLGERC
jgi:hypothetical protein